MDLKRPVSSHDGRAWPLALLRLLTWNWLTNVGPEAMALDEEESGALSPMLKSLTQPSRLSCRSMRQLGP